MLINLHFTVTVKHLTIVRLKLKGTNGFCVDGGTDSTYRGRKWTSNTAHWKKYNTLLLFGNAVCPAPHVKRYDWWI